MCVCVCVVLLPGVQTKSHIGMSDFDAILV